MQSSEKRILSVACFGHFLCHYNMMAFPVLVLPLTSLMNLELAQVLALSSWMYTLFGLSSIIWGPLADRVGAKPLLTAYFCGAGLCGLGAAWFADSPGMFMLFLSGIGLFSGVHHPVGLGLISKGTRRVSLCMGYHGMAGSMGLAMGPLLTGLINWMAGPSGAYVFLGLLNLSGMLLLALAPPASGECQQFQEVEGKTTLFWGPVAIILFCMMLGGMGYRMTTVILPSLLELRADGLFSALGLKQLVSASVLASLVTSLIYLLGVLAQYAGGRIGERFDQRYAYMTLFFTLVPLALATYWLQNGPLAIVTALFLFNMVAYQPLENAITGLLTPSHLRYSAYGAKCAAAFGVGALAVFFAAGMEKNYGIQSVLPAVGLIGIVSGLSVFALIVASNRAFGAAKAYRS